MNGPPGAMSYMGMNGGNPTDSRVQRAGLPMDGSRGGSMNGANQFSGLSAPQDEHHDPWGSQHGATRFRDDANGNGISMQQRAGLPGGGQQQAGGYMQYSNQGHGRGQVSYGMGSCNSSKCTQISSRVVQMAELFEGGFNQGGDSAAEAPKTVTYMTGRAP